MPHLITGTDVMRADRRLEMHRDLAFNCAVDPRVSTSFVLIGVIALLVGSVFMAIGPELKSSRSVPRTADGQARSTQIRIVGAPAREGVACEQQTWPNIDQHCLVSAKQDTKIGNKPEVTPEDAKLSPLTATGTVGKIQPTTQAAANNGLMADNAGAHPTWDVLASSSQSEATVGFASDETQELPVHKPVRRRSGFPFKLPFGFRF
jgi:hypothetical protein